MPIIQTGTHPIREPIAQAPAYGNIDPKSLQFSGDMVFIDTETTGIDPDADAIVEIALVRFTLGGPSRVFHSLVNPGFPIPPAASAVHHITDEDVANAPSLQDLKQTIAEFMHGATPVAHNAKFDALFVDPVIGNNPNPKNWLCTYRLSRHVLTEAPSHGNMALRYWLKTKPTSMGLGAHRAIDDVYASMENLYHMLRVCQEANHTRTPEQKISSIDQVRELANQPIVTTMMPFGKHVGKDFEEIPGDYFDWALTNMVDLDPDLKYSMELEIQKRARRHGLSQSLGRGASSSSPEKIVAAATMNFGKYNGTALTQVPSDYFQFLLDKGIRLDPAVKKGIDEELERRAQVLPTPMDTQQSQARPILNPRSKRP
jgi:exodeoxyribonuclease X